MFFWTALAKLAFQTTLFAKVVKREVRKKQIFYGQSDGRRKGGRRLFLQGPRGSRGRPRGPMGSRG